MVKDRRYKTIKLLIEAGHITEYEQIFSHIPKTTVAEELGINFTRFDQMITTVGKIKVDDILIISNYFELEPATLFGLITAQYISRKKGIKKK